MQKRRALQVRRIIWKSGRGRVVKQGLLKEKVLLLYRPKSKGGAVAPLLSPVPTALRWDDEMQISRVVLCQGGWRSGVLFDASSVMLRACFVLLFRYLSKFFPRRFCRRNEDFNTEAENINAFLVVEPENHSTCCLHSELWTFGPIIRECTRVCRLLLFFYLKCILIIPRICENSLFEIGVIIAEHITYLFLIASNQKIYLKSVSEFSKPAIKFWGGSYVESSE